MNERDLVLKISQNVLRYVDVPPDVTDDFFTRIRALPDAAMPRLRALLATAHRELVATEAREMEADEAVVNIVKAVCDEVGIRGFEKGVYVGIVRENMEREDVWPRLPALAAECRTLIETSGFLASKG